MNLTHTTITTLAAGLLILGSAACSNPADNVPAADVSETTTTPAPVETTGQTFTIGEGSAIGFIGSKITGQHDGGFTGFEGQINLVDGDPAKSQVHISIDTTTLWADNEKLTGHLKSADFFDVANFPTATFTSTEIVAEDDGYKVTGTLDLHGVTRTISFPAAITVSPDGVTVKAEFYIMRFDFDIVYSGKTDDLIRDEVVIKLDLAATSATDA
ncbi:MAG: YceI family protein [Acidobacteria bacterium]|nr:MAG: YceI family protein [Acidobacteriota bacterium]